MRSRLAILIFFCSLAAYGQQQVPGYMGKRFTVGYSASVSPNLIGQVQNNSGIPVLTNALNVSYVRKKNKEWCFSLRYSSRTILTVIPETAGKTVEDKYQSVDYCIGSRRYNKSKFAPLGNYGKWEFMLSSGWVNYESYQAPSASGGTLSTYSGGHMTMDGWGGSYGRGVQRIIDDKFTLDFGIRAGFMFIRGDGYVNQREANIVSTVRHVINWSPIVNAHVGVGFLAF